MEIKAAHVYSKKRNTMLSTEGLGITEERYWQAEAASCSFAHGNVYCIAFEQEDSSLEDELKRRDAVRTGNHTPDWLETCQTILSNVAYALHHLHHRGMIHGHIEPKNVLKCGDSWKLSGIGLVTPVGCAMSGFFRRCVPPESVVTVTSISNGGGKDVSALVNKFGTGILKPNIATSPKHGVQNHKIIMNACVSPMTPIVEGKEELEDERNEDHTDEGKQTVETDNPPLPMPETRALPPVQQRKRRGFFLFTMREMGLADYGWYESPKQKYGYARSLGTRDCDDSISEGGSKMSMGFSTMNDEEKSQVQDHTDEGKQTVETDNPPLPMPETRALPPVQQRKRRGFFLFTMREMGLADYGWYESPKQKYGYARSLGTRDCDDSISEGGSKMSMGFSTMNDEEKSQVQKAISASDRKRLLALAAGSNTLGEKEREWLRAIAEEHDLASRKQLPAAVGRKKQLTDKKHRKNQRKKAHLTAQQVYINNGLGLQDINRRGPEAMSRDNSHTSTVISTDVQFAAEKCTASPAWDIFSLGVLLARLLLETSSVLPVFALTEEKCMEMLSSFHRRDVEVSYPF